MELGTGTFGSGPVRREFGSMRFQFPDQVDVARFQSVLLDQGRDGFAPVVVEIDRHFVGLRRLEDL